MNEIFILPFDGAGHLAGVIPQLGITRVIDTRKNRWKGKFNQKRIEGICSKLDVKCEPSVRLSEGEPIGSPLVGKSIEKVSKRLEKGNVLLLGGTSDWKTNHLVYDVGHQMQEHFELPVSVIDPELLEVFDFDTLDVQPGGDFSELGFMEPGSDEGEYYKILLDVMFETKVGERHVLRDFMFTTDNMVYGIPNYPDSPTKVIASAKRICAELLEPIYEQFGDYAITYGYKNRRGMHATKPSKKANNSEPHHWDRGTYGNRFYSRIDVLPYCVERGGVSRDDFAKWLMYNLDIDLLMQFQRSNSYCITLGGTGRRVWLEWVSMGRGTNGGNSLTKMGEHYWNEVFPYQKTKPVFHPSNTGGRMWSR